MTIAPPRQFRRSPVPEGSGDGDPQKSLMGRTPENPDRYADSAGWQASGSRACPATGC